MAPPPLARPALAAALPLTLALTLAACASSPAFASVTPLCGTWRSEAGAVERWWIEGRDLRGEGRVGESSERLALVAEARGYVYVAEPGGAEPTRFAPIDPGARRFAGPAPDATARWSWANYDHDFPQEIHYVLIGEQLEATIAGPGEGDGGRSMAWTFERVAACGEDEA